MDTAQTAHLTTAPPPRRRRRTFPIVDARFQWKYTLIITALGVGITAAMGIFLYRAHRDNTRLLELEGNVMLQEQVMLRDQIFLLYIIALVVVMAVFLALWGLIVTHRISGPLYIIGRYLDELAEGRYPDMRPLRKRDELRDFFASFEEAVNALRARDVAALRAANEAIAKAQKALEGDAKEGLAQAIAALESQRDVLAASLGGASVEE